MPVPLGCGLMMTKWWFGVRKYHSLVISLVKMASVLTHPKCRPSWRWRNLKISRKCRRFLGMTNYLSRFTTRLASLSAPLHDLCKKDSDFQWHPEHATAFNHIKDEISRVTNLQFYDRSTPVTLQVDASNRGLGVAMLQDGRPVAFANKASTEAERRYSTATLRKRLKGAHIVRPTKHQQWMNH